MKKPLLLLAALMAIHSPSLRADVLVNADFDSGYSPGDLGTQSGGDDLGFSGPFSTPDSSGGTTAEVVSGGLTYTSGDITVAGGTQSTDVTSTTGNVVSTFTRPLEANLSGATLFERFVINPLSPSTNSATYLQLTLGNTPNNSFEGEEGGVLGVAGPDGTFGGDSSLSLSSGNNLLIAEFVWNSNTSSYSNVEFFLNPDSTSLGTPDVTIATSGTNLGEDLGFVIANTSSASGTETYGIDSIAVATEYSDLVTETPEPSTIALLLVSSGGLLAFRLRRKSAV